MNGSKNVSKCDDLRYLQSKVEFLKTKEAEYAKLITYNQQLLGKLQCLKCCNHLGIDFDSDSFRNHNEKENNSHFLMTEIIHVRREREHDMEADELLDLRQETRDLETQIMKYLLIRSVMNDHLKLFNKKEEVKQLQVTLENICAQILDVQIDWKKSQPVSELDHTEQVDELKLHDKSQLFMEKQAILAQVRADLHETKNKLHRTLKLSVTSTSS
jgi:hypothetical protein